MNDNASAINRAERIRFFGGGRGSFEPLGDECKLVTLRPDLAHADFERLAGLMQNRPEVTLRVHTSHCRDLEFLKYFPCLRHLSVGLWELDDITGFSYVSQSLQTLSFDTTKKRFSLKFLNDMPQLDGLYLEGHTKDIASVSSLTQLTSLGLRCITLPDLSMLVPLRHLRSFDLRFGATQNLAHLEELPELRTLNLLRINKLKDLTCLAGLRSLQKICLDSMRNVTSLPSLDRLTHLEEVTLEAMKGLTELSAIAAAPNLRQLTIAGMPQLDVDAFRCLVGHPTLKKLQVWSSLGGVAGLKKAVHEAVQRLLPDVTQP